MTRPLGWSWIEADERAGRLVQALLSGVEDAWTKARALLPELDATPETISLADARDVIAREHGSDTWNALRVRFELRDLEDATDPPAAARLAILAAEVGELEALLRAHPDVVRATGKNDNTLLHLAAGSGEVACVQALLASGADVNARNSHGWTPMHNVGYAAPTEPRPGPQAKSAAIAPLLVDAGAQMDLDADVEGSTPLAVALFWGHASLADLLSTWGVHPPNLRIAAGLGRADLIDGCFASGGALTPAALQGRAFHRPHSGWPEWESSDDRQEVLDEALAWSCASGRIDVVEPLLSRGADVNGIAYLSPALHKVVCTGYIDVARKLIACGADVNLPAGFGGQTGVSPLHVAVWGGVTAMVELLLEHGADVDAEDADNHSTPAGWAAFFERPDLVRLLSDRK